MSKETDKVYRFLCNSTKFGAKKPKIRGSKKVVSRKQSMPVHDRESTVVREVVACAKRMGIPLWRQQAGMVQIGQSMMKLAPTGAADLTGVIAPYGIRLEVECKRRDGKGRWSDDQKLWADEMNKVGCAYLLVKSGNEFEERIKKLLDLLERDCNIDTKKLNEIVSSIR